MAGSLVKWWKHKILGGYKQFSVQECTTDSEELMYHQVRASSSCSAPPDLLLVSDRENNIPLRSPVVNIIAAAASTTAPPTTTTSPSSGINACHITSATNNNQQRHNQKLQYHHHQQQQQQQQQTQNHQVTAQQLSLVYNNGAKDIIGSSNGTGSGGTGGKHQKQSGISNSNKQHGQLQPTQDIQPTSTVSHDIVEGQIETQQTSNHASSKHHQQQQNQPQQQQQHHHHNHQQQHQRPEEHIRLEEFTCDVSVEGGKSSQPLQFSFTFYDLDGHHGKITKDDIVGIVYTIYESIGKSVVVPHSGSKTINVRLTVSPEGKSKSTKNKKTLDQSLNTHQKAQHTALASNTQATTTRRLHRYRPRKLIKSDEEDDDSNSDKERIENLSHVLNQKTATKTQKLNKLKAEQNCCAQQQNQIQHPIQTDLPNSPLDNNIYDNLKANSPSEACRECLAAADETHNSSISPLVSAATTTTPSQFPVASKTTNTTNEAYMKHVASTRIKMLRKSRKQKHQDCLETRQRSLSVGNETCWKNRHLQTKQPNHQQLLWQAEHQLNHSVGGGDVVDGVQLRNPLKNGKTMMAAQKRNSAECWKTALNRNDLISIIRESMEKNRLCFQLNGKPQANVSPIRQQSTSLKQQSQTHKHQQQIANSSSNNNNKHSQQQHQVSSVTCAQRQRSNTVSKIPTLIANHNNAAHHSVSPQHHQRSSSCANTTSNNNNNNSQQHDTNVHEHQNNTNSSISSNNIYHHHLQPHIPIYHQQMAINPAVIAAQNALLTASTSGNVVGSLAGHHGKMNLCGYDSFLHATICGGGLSHSPPPPPPPQALTNHTSLNTQITSPSPSNISGLHPQHQQIATVQPIMSNNTQHTSKRLSLAMTPNQIKTSKILHSGSYINQIQSTADTQQQQQQHHLNSNTKPNSPQYHGYQRLPSTSKHNLSALHLLSPNAEKRSLSELNKWRKDQGKNYDQLLYDKLSEKLQQTNLVASNNSQHSRESNQKRKQRLIRQRRANALVQETNNVSLAATVLTNTICSKENTDYATMLPIVGDPVECENLLGQTSDEETHSQHDTTHLKAKEDMTNCKQQPQQHRHVAEGTLVDLDDINEATTPLENAQHTEVNVDALLRVEDEAEVHNPHNLVDDLEIDEDLEEELDEELEELADVAESGRNSANSNNGSNTGAAATLVNTNGANTTSTSINSSSLIHRYVHEHIHHHYHHFEEKEE